MVFCLIYLTLTLWHVHNKSSQTYALVPTNFSKPQKSVQREKTRCNDYIKFIMIINCLSSQKPKAADFSSQIPFVKKVYLFNKYLSKTRITTLVSLGYDNFFKKNSNLQDTIEKLHPWKYNKVCFYMTWTRTIPVDMPTCMRGYPRAWPIEGGRQAICNWWTREK